MSLQLLAKQMEAKGRKGDSMLVHMTPGEVAGLQKLAEAAGGSLSVNPETGLVEANFLKRMLPTLVGIGVGIGTGNPFLGAAAGAAVGGYQAKKNDQDVGMGALMGAAGGYGGAGLGAGLTAAGGTTAANVAADTAAKTAAEEAAKNAALEEAAKQQVAEQSAKTFAQEQTKNQLIGAATPDMTMSGAAQPDLAMQYGLTDPTPAMTPMPSSVQPMSTAPAPVEPTLTASENLSRAGEGIGQLATKGGRTAFGGEFGMGTAMAGMAPLMMPEAYKPTEDDELKEDNERYVYDYDPGRTFAERSGGSSAERKYFADERFKNRRTERVAQGGLLSLAEGGETAAPAEGMSGASKAAFDYLMGRSASSSGRQMAAPAQATEFVAPERTQGTISGTKGYTQINDGPYAGMYQATDGKLAYDPQAGQYYRTDDVFKYVPPPPEKFGGFGEASGFGGFGGFGGAGGAAAGGLVGLAKGGMKSGGFVIPADVVSMVGEGNTDAGYSRIKSMVPGATAIKGKDGGQADTVKTSIEGKQPARVAHGEMYVPPETVKRMGGAKKLYAMMDKVRAQATGSKKQIKPVSLKKALT